jgi:hypothetical protein
MVPPRVGAVSAAVPPAEPEELSLKELTRLYRELVRQQLDTHATVNALRLIVYEEHVPELVDLDDRMDRTEADVRDLRGNLDDFRKDFASVKSSQGALVTIAGASSAQLALIAQHLGVPLVKGLNE